MALVYVFRTDASAATFDVPAVRIDEKLVVELHAAEYTAIHLPAGRHVASSDPDPLRASASSRPLAFAVGPGQVAALALQYVGAPPPSTGGQVPLKEGTVELPRTESAYLAAPFAWAFVPDIESTALGAELRKRRYRATASRELSPG
jgi:hypothetical protein